MRSPAALLIRTPVADHRCLRQEGEDPELRTGVTSVTLQDNWHDGGAAVGILTYMAILTQWRVGGVGPDEPDATWEFSLQRCTYQNAASFFAVYAFSLQVSPVLADKQLRLNANIAELNVRDCVTKFPGSTGDGVYYVITVTDALVERSRFERNGILGDTSGAGGGYVSPPPGGSIASTVAYVSTAWTENGAGRGPATYILPGNFVVLYRQCTFRCAPSRLMPSWLHNALIRPIARVTS